MNNFENLNSTPDGEQQNNADNEKSVDSQSYEEITASQSDENYENNDRSYRADNTADMNQGNFTQNTNYYPYSNNPQNTNYYPYSNNPQNNQPYNYNPNNQSYNNGSSGQPDSRYSGYYSNPYPYANNQKQYAYPDDDFNGNNGKKKKGKGIFVFVVAAVCILTIIGIVVSIFDDDTVIQPSTNDTNTPIENVEELVTNATPSDLGNTATDGALRPKDIYKKVLASSVGVLVYDSRASSVVSEGTGVVFCEDKDGEYTYIITCAHVISDTGVSLRVKMSDNKEYAAQVVGYDTRTDIGVVRIKANGLVAAEIGDSSKLAVGDPVYAIGNPGGVEFANSFTNGMVSAIDRPVSSSKTGYSMECIQHTAAINPGNSGGALVNEYGQIIGINSMKIVADEYEGMGFAVPSSVFTKIVNEIIANGYVTNRPKLGITYLPASEYERYAMFVAIKGLPSGSIIIYSITDDSDLRNTDVKTGDLIYAVNGVEMDDTDYLAELIENGKVGDELTLSLIRINSDYSYKDFEVKVKLVEDKGDTYLIEEETTTASNGNYLPDDYYEDFFEEFYEYFNP